MKDIIIFGYDKIIKNKDLAIKSHMQLFNWFDIKKKIINQIDVKDKYYFTIDIFDINFFNDLKKASELSLSKILLDDIRNRKAKILVLCCTETIVHIKNIYKIFDIWSKKFNIPMNNIIFCSGDYSLDKYKNVNYIAFSIFEYWMRSAYINRGINTSRIQMKRSIQNKTKRSKVFLNYNRRPTFDRCNLVYKLKQQNLFKYGLVSLGWKKELLEPHVIKSFPDSFLDTLPISFDDSNLEKNLFLSLEKKDFLNSYISLVSESLVAPTVIFPTEKIWKSIMFLHPFIVIAEAGFLKQLKSFGYKTFSKWFDESYDKEPDKNKRLDLLINEVKKITEMTHEELQNMLVEMLPTLKYNLNTFLNRGKSKQFKKQLKEKLIN